MSDAARYEVLESAPAYGPMYVPISENNERTVTGDPMRNTLPHCKYL